MTSESKTFVRYYLLILYVKYTSDVSYSKPKLLQLYSVVVFFFGYPLIRSFHIGDVSMYESQREVILPLCIETKSSDSFFYASAANTWACN
jgi:hypothetical protein